MLARAASTFIPRPIDWLWPGYLALGKITLLDGDPGLGKSWITLDLAARLSTASPWPNPQPNPPASPQFCIPHSKFCISQNSLFFCPEDNDADTISPRLRLLGADLARVYIHPSDQPLPRLPADLGLLEEAVVRADARLVVLDPLPAFLASSVPLTSDEPLRNLLHALATLAERTRSAFLIVRHLTKKPGRQPLYRGSGSIALIAACRLAFLVAPHPADQTRTILAQSKNNLAPLQPSLAYRLFPSTDKSASPLQWLGPVRYTAAELTHAKFLCPSRARAAHFLTTLLQSAPQTTTQIFTAAKKLGLTPRTLQRTFHDLGLKKHALYHNGRTLTYWLLPDQEPPQLAGQQPLDLDRWLPPP